MPKTAREVALKEEQSEAVRELGAAARRLAKAVSDYDGPAKDAQLLKIEETIAKLKVMVRRERETMAESVRRIPTQSIPSSDEDEL